MSTILTEDLYSKIVPKKTNVFIVMLAKNNFMGKVAEDHPQFLVTE